MEQVRTLLLNGKDPLPVTTGLWQTLPAASFKPKVLARSRIVTASRLVPAYVQFDKLRTSLLQRMRHNDWKTIAITSPTAGCGKTSVTVNLALSLAHHLDLKTVVVDLDLRKPKVGPLLDLRARVPMEKFLKGEASVSETFYRYSNNVAIAVNDLPVRFASELLQSPTTGRAIQDIRQQLAPDILIFDMPPMLPTDDVGVFIPKVDCALLVLGAGASTKREADLCERELARETNVAGVVLNKCKFPPDTYGY